MDAGEGGIETGPSGYRLDINPDCDEADRFEDLAARASGGPQWTFLGALSPIPTKSR
jgi:hypothetical protein